MGASSSSDFWALLRAIWRICIDRSCSLKWLAPVQACSAKWWVFMLWEVVLKSRRSWSEAGDIRRRQELSVWWKYPNNFIRIVSDKADFICNCSSRRPASRSTCRKQCCIFYALLPSAFLFLPWFLIGWVLQVHNLPDAQLNIRMPAKHKFLLAKHILLIS